jgi:tRNA U34 2-thiouridine synthase MnmA/TrmU
MPKALAMMSGGLDSTLAAALMLRQGVPVHGLTFVSLFTASRSPDRSKLQSVRAAEMLGVPIKVVHWSREFLDLVKTPEHGYGSNMNPCIDCRMRVLQKARDLMPELGCDFVVTGEVLGERPMSQRRQPMDMIQARSGLKGLLLRPLSAQLLPPTVPEERGWVDRSRLMAIQGRCRKPQMELAKELGITEYPTPAGGCLLTDPAFAVRFRDLLDHQPGFDLGDAHLLKVGRHFRLTADARCIVGRDHAENRTIRTFARAGDLLMEARDFKGPLALLRGRFGQAEVALAAAITVRYGKGLAESQAAVSWRDLAGPVGEVVATPAKDADLAPYRLASHEGARRGE